MAVFAEKPLAVRSEDCAALGKLAAAAGVALGTGHNSLFAPAYERLVQDVTSGRLGRLDQVDIVWNKPLPQVQFGPFGGWLFKDSRNVLFEVGPHSFAHLAHLLGGDVQMQAEARDPVRLPNNLVFHRQWEIQGQQGRVGARLRFSFIDGYPEHYVHVRGSAASATVDFELGTYTLREHSQDLLDFNRFAASVRGAKDALVQAGTTLGSFVLSKAGLPFDGGPYQTSISKAVRTFYEALAAGCDIATLDRAIERRAGWAGGEAGGGDHAGGETGGAAAAAQGGEGQDRQRRGRQRRRGDRRHQRQQWPRQATDHPRCWSWAAPASSGGRWCGGCGPRGWGCGRWCVTPAGTPRRWARWARSW